MRIRLLITIGPALLLIALQAYLCQELFRYEFLNQLASIEWAYISLARYIRDHWQDLTWFPQWYGGIPFQNAYPPLLHLLSALASSWLDITPGLAYHAVSGAMFSLGAATLYWFTLVLTRSVRAGFVAGALYAVWSPSAMLVQPIWADLGEMVVGRRLHALAGWGEGPHVMSLTLLPLALGLVWLAWGKRHPLWDLAAAAACAAVVLTNWLGAFTLAIGVVCLLVARPRAWAHTGMMALLAYALAAPWIPPSTIRVVQGNARMIGADYSRTYAMLPVRAVLLIAGLAILAYLFHRWRVPLSWRFAVPFAAILAGITLGAYWYQVEVIPQSPRYHLQMEMALCLLAGLLAGTLLSRLPRWVTVLAMALLVASSVAPVKQARGAARGVHLRPLDFRQTSLGRFAIYLRDSGFEDRIYAPGAKQFLMNVFADTPQLDGGFGQGLVNQFERHAWYGINFEPDRDSKMVWLRALGIHAVVLPGEQSMDPYKALRHPESLADLEEIWRDGEERLVRVPHRSRSIARVIRREALVLREFPLREEMRGYVNELENRQLPVASWQWLSNHQAMAVANLRPEHLISLQMTYHKGWSARVNGQDKPLRKDGMGQMWLEPACAGACRIELSYEGGWEMRIARWLPWIALLWIAWRRLVYVA